MNSSPELMLELIEAYEKKLIELEKNEVTRLKEGFQLLQALYRSVYEMLIQKGILKPDPYKNERHFSDIYVPAELNVTDTELDEQLSITLAEYDNLLDFLNSYTPFKVSQLGLKRIKVFSGLIRFIDWSKLSPNSANLVTRGVTVLIDKIRGGSDQFAGNSLISSINKLDQLTKDMLRDLKVLADFKREEYKLFLRQRIIQPNAQFANGPSKEDFTKLIKQLFVKAMEGEPFFPELINELYEELYQNSEDSVKKSILAKFHVQEVRKSAETQPAFNLREILMDGVRNLGMTSRYFDEAIIKLKESSEMLENKPKTFMERFKAWIVSLSQGGKKTERSYEIELIDITTAAKKRESLNFGSFTSTLQRKAKYLTSMLVKTSGTMAKIDTLNDDQLYELLEANMNELKGLHDRMDALDTYFKAEAIPQDRARMRGIKIELTSIKNGITLVNQRLHEFVAKKDEMEQLKKLGIKVQ